MAIGTKSRSFLPLLVLTIVVGVTVLLCAGGYTARTILSVTAVGELTGIAPPLWLHQGSYRDVIEAIDDGSYAAGAHGPVPLPSQIAHITPRGEVYVAHTSSTDFIVLFPTWYGRGADVQGHLYSTTPITTRRGLDHILFDLEGFRLRRLRGPWYWAIRRMD